MTPDRLDAPTLHQRLRAGGEWALIDLRPRPDYLAGHILPGVNIIPSDLVAHFPQLIPGRGAYILLADGGQGEADEAVSIIHEFGYTLYTVLAGGIPAWIEAAFEMFEREDVTGTALVERVDRVCNPPKVTAPALAKGLDSARPLLVLDARP